MAREMYNIENRIKSILSSPIKIVAIYLFATIYLFFCGPNKYILFHQNLTLLFLVSATSLLVLGFYADLLFFRLDSNYVIQEKNNDVLKKYFYVIVIPVLILYILMYFSRTNETSISLQNFANLGEAYRARFEKTKVLWIERLLVIFSPLFTVFIPYCSLVWYKVNLIKKSIIFLTIVFSIYVDMVQGINKGLADLVIYLLCLRLQSISRICIINQTMMKDFTRKFISFILGLILGTSIIFIFFSMTISSRLNYNADNLSENAKIFSDYLTQGYQPLDWSFRHDFTTTYGLGHSMYLLDASRGYSSDKLLFERSYIGKNYNTYDYDYHLRWSTLYVWFANDISFIGVLPLMFLLGWFFSKSWKTAVFTNELSSVTVSCLLFQLILYIPANNQIFQLETNLLGSWSWIIYWIISHRSLKGAHTVIINKEIKTNV